MGRAKHRDAVDTEPKDRLGVVISDEAIADIVGWTVLECYGVVGMTSANAYRGVAQLLARDKLHQGIRIRREGDRVKVELHIIVEHGLNVAEVAGNVRAQVTYNVERTTGLTVSGLSIHVQGVRVGHA